jgi:hypothetical protein
VHFVLQGGLVTEQEVHLLRQSGHWKQQPARKDNKKRPIKILFLIIVTFNRYISQKDICSLHDLARL